MTSTILHPMAWTNERLRISCSDSSGLKKALLKMIVVDNNNTKNNNVNNETYTDFLTNRGLPHNMSLLKFFAINALELSAPASPVLLQQSNSITPGWLQLAGHPKSIAPVANGIVRKRVTGPSDSEVIAYRGLTADTYASKLIPKFMGVRTIEGDSYIELQDLLHGFKDPNVIDIKMGRRTFLESEVTNKTLRSDLYKKMISVNPNAPTTEEHNEKAVTKLRYMLFREQMSSSQTKGYRIEAMKMKGSSPITDLKTVKSESDVQQTFTNFLQNRRSVTKELIKRLKTMRAFIEKSDYFQTHEIVGSSIFIVYDDHQVGAWMIDFAKCSLLPNGIKVDHRKEWVPGNCEEGLLHGLDELIKVFENVYHSINLKCDSRKFNIKI